jgi:hypothetical protein
MAGVARCSSTFLQRTASYPASGSGLTRYWRRSARRCSRSPRGPLARRPARRGDAWREVDRQAYPAADVKYAAQTLARDVVEELLEFSPFFILVDNRALTRHGLLTPPRARRPGAWGLGRSGRFLGGILIHESPSERIGVKAAGRPPKGLAFPSPGSAFSFSAPFSLELRGHETYIDFGDTTEERG